MKKKNIKYLMKISIVMLVIIVFSLVIKATLALANNEKQYSYLSDIKYKSINAKNGFYLDKNIKKELIKLSIDGEDKAFLKGIFAHANSTIVYDLSLYNYDYFTAYIGVDITTRSLNNGKGQGDGAKFEIYTSQNGENWTEKLQDEKFYHSTKDGRFIKIDIKNAKYLKLVTKSGINEWSDHSVYADAKLIREGYVEQNLGSVDYIKTVEEYDLKLKEYYKNNNSAEITNNYELMLLQRKLVQNVGYDKLQLYASSNEENRQTINWLFNNLDVLRLYIMGGNPNGNYMASLKVLNELYQEYKSDFDNVEKLNNKWDVNLTYGDLYKKMAISLSLTHSVDNIGLWMQKDKDENKSEACRRYAIYKYMHKNGLFKISDKIDNTSIFESLRIEEMRWIMMNEIDDEEILWLNAYVKTKIDEEPNKAWGTPHPHMNYIFPNYQNPVYYAEENKNYFNELFSVKRKFVEKDTLKPEEKIGLFDLEYTIPGGKYQTYKIKIARGNQDYKLQKVWMNFKNKFGTGAVCGGISKSGANIRSSIGIPATVIGQPGHAAILFYTKNQDSKAYWGIDNDVGGWTVAEKGERLILNWGNAKSNYAKGSNQVVYMVLAQEALNDYSNLEKAEKLVMLADSYEGDLLKQEEIYEKALKIQSINLDAWLGLINVYNKSNVKTQDEYYNLAKRIGENLKYFPLPMYQLTNLIKPKLTTMGNEEQNIQNSYKFTLLQTRILTEASQISNNATDKVLQPGVTKVEANYLLGKSDKTIASFSFDGEDAGKIVLSDRFNGNGIRWDYAITRKKDTQEKVWKEVFFSDKEEHKLKLSKEELDSITAENDIYIHIIGVNYNEENLYKIDIKESKLNSDLYANDLENKLIGITPRIEWKLNEQDEWIAYKNKKPDLTGEKTLTVRLGATGQYLASKENRVYKFTNNNEINTKKYISIAHLSIDNVSSQATGGGQKGDAINVIDGNINTRWHSAWNGSDKDKFIVIKLDEPKYLSALDYIPAGGGNGKIGSAQILVSIDGKEWNEVVSETNWSYDEKLKSVEFESIKAQYIKIIGKRTQSASNKLSYIAASMFNLYEDTTKNNEGGQNNLAIPTIKYSTTNKTNKNVIATIEFDIENIKIINNGGNNSYVFTKNGSFDFEYQDTDGTTKKVKAIVNWIKKDKPVGKIKYDITTITNKNVIATLEVEEGIKVTSEGGKTHLFLENGIFDFEFEDDCGNKGVARAEVNWIDRESPTAKVSYSIKEKTNKSVVAKLIDVSEEIIILNNSGKNEYIFLENGNFIWEIVDKAGNKSKIEAKVDWIIKLPEDYYFISDKYKIEENNISKVFPKTKVSEFRENINTNQNIVFKDKEGKLLSENTIIGTGMKIIVGNIKEYTISVKGDVNGDGESNFQDILQINKHRLGKSELQSIYRMAGDVNGDGKADFQDILQINKYRLGKVEKL